jgi:hypothetical protein
MKKIISVIIILIRGKIIVSILFCCLTFSSFTFAQEKSDIKDMSISLTNYFFTYTENYNAGSYALGPTVKLNSDGKISLQIGVLYEFKKYTYFRSVIDYTNGVITVVPYDVFNLFIPLYLHYNYLRKERISYNMVAGVMLGGHNTLLENNRATQTTNFNFYFGTGLTYKIKNSITLSPSISIRYNGGYYHPGIMFDISFIFNSNKLLL